MNKYYVYGLFDKNENCFYIGKGTDRRMYNHRKNFKANKITNYFLYCKLKSLQNKNEDFTERIIIDNLSEEDALKEESILIEKYGRKINGGVLCNLLEGGTQPPSVQYIKEMYGEEGFKKIKEKQVKSYMRTHYNKGLKYVDEIKKMLEAGELMMDIAKKLNLDRNTISKWIKRYNLVYDDSKKRKLEKERLKSFRKINSEKVQKTSKTYTIITPNGDEIVSNKLVNFCKDNNLDYRGLRNTYNKFKRNGENCRCKGYYILCQIENDNMLPIFTA